MSNLPIGSERRSSCRLLVSSIVAIGMLACNGRGAVGTPGSPDASLALTTAAARDAARPPSASSSSFYADRFSKRPSVAAMTDLGRRLFSDPELSASRQMSCSTCHDPRFGYGPPDDRPTQPGGPDMKSPGLRAVPSLRYLHTLPPFAEHHFDEAIDESVDQGPTGGYGWDGRADSAHDQARLPLTSPFEMANDSVESVATRVAQGAYAQQFRDTFGDDVFADPARAAAGILLALEVFQQSPKDFYPYSSRYDGWLRHKLELTTAETRGLALFNDPNKGNCASCHPSSIRQGAFPQFTDFGFVALAVPRNRTLAANRDPHAFDLGLCGPLRKDLATHKEYCGLFRAPPIRNAAVRRVFFHNGAFHSLREVVEFYAQRDTNPGKWYPGGDHQFDDLPLEFRRNVKREPPFGRARGGAPALAAGEIADLVAFLKTLTDADLLNN